MNEKHQLFLRVLVCVAMSDGVDEAKLKSIAKIRGALRFFRNTTEQEMHDVMGPLFETQDFDFDHHVSTAKTYFTENQKNLLYLCALTTAISNNAASDREVEMLKTMAQTLQVDQKILGCGLEIVQAMFVGPEGIFFA
jgi:hypothetical protein